MSDAPVMTVTGYDDVRAALANTDLSRGVDYDRFERGNIDEATLVMLHGEEHRRRRRVENGLFRREMFESYERDLFPDIVAHTLDTFVDVTDPAGADLMEIGGLFTVVLAARTAGIDFDRESLADRQRLREFVHQFAFGSAINTSDADPETVKAEMRAALQALQREFMDASWARRAELVRRVDTGEVREDDLPMDALTRLLRHRDELGMDPALIARETAMFFTAGAHTSTQTITNTLHLVFSWVDRRPRDWARLAEDLPFAQRCVHEALRFRPTNPVIQRRALRDKTVGSTPVPEGTVLTLDTISANRDAAAFGASAGVFDPHRALPEGMPPWGLSFGHGMHLCIARTLAVGLPQDGRSAPPPSHVYGLIPIAVQAVVRRGVGPHPTRPPEPDTKTRRWTRWRRYPVAFDPARAPAVRAEEGMTSIAVD